MAQKLICFSCSKENWVEIPVGRRDECKHCGADLHSCKNCGHYEPKAYNECAESAADVVKEKDRSNFCDHFTPSQSDRLNQSNASDLKAKAEALFKK